MQLLLVCDVQHADDAKTCAGGGGLDTHLETIKAAKCKGPRRSKHNRTQSQLTPEEKFVLPCRIVCSVSYLGRFFVLVTDVGWLV